MKKQMKQGIVLMAMMATMALGACTPGTPSSSEESASSEAPASSIDQNATTVAVTLKSNRGKVGTTVRSIGFTVTVSQKGKSYDLSKSTLISLAITGPDGKAYTKNSMLIEPGDYTIVASYKDEATSEPTILTIEGGTPEADVGFTKTAENFDNVNFWKLGQFEQTEHLKSWGDQKILVLPIDFADLRFESTSFVGGEASVLHDINAAFFGESEETSWESLKSFYYKSSYGKLNLDGVVAPVYHSPLTGPEVEKLTQEDFDKVAAANGADTTSDEYKVYSQHWNVSWYFLEVALKNYVDNNPTVDLSQYDNDHDGYIDGVWMVNSHKSESGDFWWAWTHHDFARRGNNLDAEGNVKETPVPYNLCWCSFDMIRHGPTPYYNDGKNIDAHTLIHETGHLMGLNDYYDTDSLSAPIYGVDMMDLNIGDHNPYTKMGFNWITPRVIDYTSDYFTTKLRPFQESGDCLLVRLNDEASKTTPTPTALDNQNDEKGMVEAYNNTPFDEYILIAYYTPTGLNAGDSQGYAEWKGHADYYGHGGTYEKDGIVAYHVDSRLIKTRPDSGGNKEQTWLEYTDTFEDLHPVYELTKAKDGTDFFALVGGSYITMRQTNTKSTSWSMNPESADSMAGLDFREISLLNSNGDPGNVKGSANPRYGKNTGVTEQILYTPDGNSAFSAGMFEDWFTYRPATATKTVFNDGTPIDFNFCVQSLGVLDDADTSNDAATLLFAKI